MQSEPAKAPLRGILALGATGVRELTAAVDAALAQAQRASLPPARPEAPDPAALAAPERLVLDYEGPPELSERLGKAQRALATDNPAAWKALAAQGIFRGRGPRPGRIAYLFPGQGSQYVNMGRELAAREPIVAQVFAEADAVMTPILGRPLSSYIFVDAEDPAALKRAELALMDMAVTQPAVLAMDIALYRLLAAYGFRPDVVTGHSLGEYAALIVAGVMPFADALEAVAARGREMTRITDGDNGWMAAVMAPLDVVESTLAEVPGYVVAANINSRSQAVIGGASQAVEQAMALFQARGYEARRIPVSHAFHTAIVTPAARPLRAVLDRLRVAPAQLPIIANLTGDFYPAGADIETIKDILERHIASPVQWVKGIETLYAAGVRAFVEVGPKKALKGFTDDLLGDRPDVVSLFTNHPKTGELASFNQALCGMYAAGYGTPAQAPDARAATPTSAARLNPDAAHLLGQALQQLAHARSQATAGPATAVYDRYAAPPGSVVITGTALGLPGAGQSLVDLDNFNLSEAYGVPDKLVEALDITSQLAMAAGLEALREAGIPLVQTWKRTSTGKYLPERWLLPEALRDETGVIFASAFPGADRMAGEFAGYFAWQNRLDQLAMLEDLRRGTADPALQEELARRATALRGELDGEPYAFDRRYLFRVLSMGHSQFAEYIGARGPNTQVNAAGASTPQALALAEDWIRGGRCRRVLVIAADDVTGDRLIAWIGAGFLAAGGTATDDRPAAALPYRGQRPGAAAGMGACALVVESEDAARERGIRGIVELLSSETANSAFHHTRPDGEHLAEVMDRLVTAAEMRFGVNRYVLAGQTVFMSHGDSASVEVAALRRSFGRAACEIVVANAKGLAGHAMAAGVEDVVAVKTLETGVVPPAPNASASDPELGLLNLSRGGRYPVQYALHLAVGLGSQVAMTLTRRIPGGPDRVDEPDRYRGWLADCSGQDPAELEVVKRVLRVKAIGGPGRAPARSAWRYGTGPSLHAAAEG